jgi:hypothetical protein
LALLAQIAVSSMLTFLLMVPRSAAPLAERKKQVVDVRVVVTVGNNIVDEAHGNYRNNDENILLTL